MSAVWRAGAAEREEWDRYRREGHTNDVGKGNRQGSKDATARAARRTIVCLREGCDALVTYGSARAQAIRERGPPKVRQERRQPTAIVAHEPGDGCSARGCCKAGTQYRPDQHIPRQRQRIADVRSGKFRMVECPRATGEPVRWEWEEELACAAADKAEAQLADVEKEERETARKRKKTHNSYSDPTENSSNSTRAGAYTGGKHRMSDCAAHPDKGSALSLAKAAHNRLYEQGIEPHPGPPTRNIPPIGTRTTCPDGHTTVSPSITPTGAASARRYKLRCTHCNADYTQRIPEDESLAPTKSARWPRATGQHTAPQAACPDNHWGHAIGQGTSGTIEGGRRAYICQHPLCNRTFSQIRPTLLGENQYREPIFTIRRKKQTGEARAAMQSCTISETNAQKEEIHITAQEALEGAARAAQTIADAEKDTGMAIAVPRHTTSTPAAVDTPVNTHAATKTANETNVGNAARTPHMGDDHVTYANAQGLCEETAWKAYVHDHILPTSSMHGCLETMWSDATAAKFAADLRDSGAGRLLSAQGKTGTQGRGCALIIRSDIPVAKDERVIYRHPEGKALAVHLTWHRIKMLVVLTHLPHEDEAQREFYMEIRRSLRMAYATYDEKYKNDHSIAGDIPAEREVIWMMDRNHICHPRLDCMPMHCANYHPEAMKGLHAMQQYLGATADAYRTFHPQGKSVTRIDRDDYATRIDAVHLTPNLTKNTQRFVDARHLPPETWIVKSERNKNTEFKVADHHIVQLTYQTSDIPRQKKPASFASDMTQNKESTATLRQTASKVLANLERPQMSPELRQQALVEAWAKDSDEYRKDTQGMMRREIARRHNKLKQLRKELRTAERNADAKETRSYRKQITRAEKSYHAAVSERQDTQRRKRNQKRAVEASETSEHVHRKIAPREAAEPVNAMEERVMQPDGSWKTTDATDNEGIHRAMLSYWKKIFQMPHDAQKRAAAEEGILDRIREKMKDRLTEEERQSMTMNAVLTTANIKEAIARVKGHTAPGRDGIPIEPYQSCAAYDDKIAEHLKELYERILEKGEMPDNMKEAVTTMVYKGEPKPRNQPANYRPVTVTATEYRILATCLAQKLAENIHKIIGDSQIGFQIKRDIGENIDLMEEILRYTNGEASEKGGAIAILDNAHAFDYVAWPFMFDALDAFGLPRCFIAMIRAMTSGISTRLKINDTVGEKINQTSGVRQGCPCSSLLFLIVMEVLLTMIREDPNIHGIEIPNAEGNDADGNRIEVCERSLADDLAVYMSDLENSIPALRKVLARFQDMSGQRVRIEKSAIVLMGEDAEHLRRLLAETNESDTESRDTEKVDPRTLWPDIEFNTVGVIVAKYHGVMVTDAEGAALRWETKIDEVIEMIQDDARVFQPRSIEGRQNLAKGRYMGKLAYTFKYQVPETSIVDKQLAKIQTHLNRLILGARDWVKQSLAKQRIEDTGLGMIDAAACMQGMWGHAIRKVMDPEARPWKNFAHYYLRRTYGTALGEGTAMLTANYSFAKIVKLPKGEITEKMRQAFKAYGSLPKLRPSQNPRLGAIADGKTEENRRGDQTRAPCKKHGIVYCVMRQKDSTTHGIQPPKCIPSSNKTQKEHTPWRPPNVLQQINGALNDTGSPWMIRTTSDLKRAVLEAQQTTQNEKKSPQTKTTKIAAISIADLQGNILDLSEKAGRARTRLTGPKERKAEELKAIMVHGDTSTPPLVPPAAIIDTIDAADLDRARTKHDEKGKPISESIEQRLKAMPSSALQRLSTFEKAAHATLQTPRTGVADSTRKEQTPIRMTRQQWRKEEIERQLLLHNAFLEEGTRIGSRSDEDTEQIACRWAENGVVRVRDVLTPDKKKLITSKDFEAKWPSLKQDTWAYEELLSSFPAEWTARLASGVADTIGDEETWWTTDGMHFQRMWTENPTKERKKAEKRSQTYCKEQNGERLYPEGDAVCRRCDSPPQNARECRIVAVHRNRNVDPEWMEGGAKALREARNAKYSHQIVSENIETCHAPLDEIALQPGGLLERHPIRMQHLRTKHASDMAKITYPVVPRAWDSRDSNEHYAHLYAGESPQVYTETLRRVFGGIRHHFIPPRMQDVLYRILVSGYDIGKNKAKKGHENCAHCRAKAGVEIEETIEHMIATCEKSKALWKMVLARWNVATGQRLDHNDLRVCMLGDRPEEERHALTEPLWRVVHAATIWTIHHAAKAQREAKQPERNTRTATVMLATVRRETQRMIANAWAQRRDSEAEQWKEWRSSGWVTTRKAGALARILEAGHLEIRGACRGEEKKEDGAQHGEEGDEKGEPMPVDTAARKNAQQHQSKETATTTQLHADSAALKIRWHIFTDGAWEGEDDDEGMRDGPPPPAGYGAAEIDTGDEHSAKKAEATAPARRRRKAGRALGSAQRANTLFRRRGFGPRGARRALH